MTKGTVWRYGLGLITLPLLAGLAIAGFNLAEAVTAPKQAPIAATPATLTAGAQVFVDNCAVCHGLPGQAEPAAAVGLWPEPPQFFRRSPGGSGRRPNPANLASFAQRRAVGNYGTIHDGVPGTGMPSFRQSLSDTQMWQAALMMGSLQNLPVAAESVVQAAVTAAQPPNSSAPTSDATPAGAGR